jgi:hypothetical protein
MDRELWNLAAVGGLAVLAGLFLVRLWQRASEKNNALREIRNKFSGLELLKVSTNAYFRGFARTWDERWRGYGILLISEDFLHFRLWERHLDFTIPVERILQCGISAKHGDKRLRRPHLQIRYRGADGEERTATWRVPRPEEWVDRLGERCGGECGGREGTADSRADA